MKFIISEKPVRQFSYVIVKVSVNVLAEILAMADGTRTAPYWMHRIKCAKDPAGNDFQLHMFKSGAKLTWSEITQSFGIYGYADGGNDIHAAMSELRALEALRSAKKHFRAMTEFNQTYKVLEGEKCYPYLKVSFDNVVYPANKAYAQ